MTEEECIESLQELLGPDHDKDAAHSIADDILCNFLKDLGYDEIVNIFNDIEKWYG